MLTLRSQRNHENSLKVLGPSLLPLRRNTPLTRYHALLRAHCIMELLLPLFRQQYHILSIIQSPLLEDEMETSVAPWNIFRVRLITIVHYRQFTFRELLYSPLV